MLVISRKDAVGAGAGAIDGTGEGIPLGDREGLSAVGEKTGVAVGARVGVRDGREVGSRVGSRVGAAVGVAVGATVVGKFVGAGVYDTWKLMESVSELSSVHVIVIVYSLTSASPETTCVC